MNAQALTVDAIDVIRAEVLAWASERDEYTDGLPLTNAERLADSIERARRPFGHAPGFDFGTDIACRLLDSIETLAFPGAGDVIELRWLENPSEGWYVVLQRET